MANKRTLLTFLLYILSNLLYGQDINKVFISKALQKEVEYFIKYSKTSIDDEIQYLTVNKKSDSLYILQTKKPIIITISGRYLPKDTKMKELVIYRDEFNNENVEDLIIENGKIRFVESEELKKQFGATLKRDILLLEPDVYLIFKDLKGFINYDYISEINKNKKWDKNMLLRKEINHTKDIRNSVIFTINQITGNLENMSFYVQDKISFIQERFGASCGNCEPCK